MANPPATLTLAELYERQGLKGKARELYDTLAHSPEEGTAREAKRRLELLGPSAAGGIRFLEELRLRLREHFTKGQASMSFREDLEGVCSRVEGAFAASVMGFDGIPIETVEPKPPPGVEILSLLVEYSGILSQVRQSTDSLQMGKASEVSIRTERMVAVARLLTPEYFVVVALGADGNVGRARYELRVTGPKISAQLA